MELRGNIIDLSSVNSVKIASELKEIVPQFLSITHESNECSWCRYSFDGTPVFVPIRKKQRQIVANMGNHIIKENVSDFQEKTRFKLNSESYYEVDDPCCSVECANAFINDNKLKPRYIDSERLLKMMTGSVILPKANSYKLLRKFGGPLSIESFRKGFASDFIVKGNIVQQAALFEKQLPLSDN